MLQYKSMLREFLSTYAETLRKARNLSQEQMAEQLRITPRAYSNLCCGRFCFSTLPLLSLLLMLDSKELDAFQRGLRGRMNELEANHES